MARGGRNGRQDAAAAFAVVQATTDTEHLGRIMSLFALASTGSMPLSNALTGTLTEHLRITWALLTNAGITVIAATIGMATRTSTPSRAQQSSRVTQEQAGDPRSR